MHINLHLILIIDAVQSTPVWYQGTCDKQPTAAEGISRWPTGRNTDGKHDLMWLVSWNSIIFGGMVISHKAVESQCFFYLEDFTLKHPKI